MAPAEIKPLLIQHRYNPNILCTYLETGIFTEESIRHDDQGRNALCRYDDRYSHQS